MQGEPIEQGVGALNISTVSNGTAPLPRCRPPWLSTQVPERATRRARSGFLARGYFVRGDHLCAGVLARPSRSYAVRR